MLIISGVGWVLRANKGFVINLLLKSTKLLVKKLWFLCEIIVFFYKYRLKMLQN